MDQLIRRHPLPASVSVGIIEFVLAGSGRAQELVSAGAHLRPPTVVALCPWLILGTKLVTSLLGLPLLGNAPSEDLAKPAALDRRHTGVFHRHGQRWQNHIENRRWRTQCKGHGFACTNLELISTVGRRSVSEAQGPGCPLRPAHGGIISPETACGGRWETRLLTCSCWDLPRDPFNGPPSARIFALFVPSSARISFFFSPLWATSRGIVAAV